MTKALDNAGQIQQYIAPQSVIANQLRYRIPKIQLCLLHEGFHPESLYSIGNPTDADNLLLPLRMAAEEHFVSLHLNARNQLIGLHEVSHGTLSSSLVHPREVFKAAFVANSYAILVCHNHPSGAKILPSPDDLSVTDQLLKSGRIVGIPLIDHLIVGPNQEAYSIRANFPELWD